MKKTFQAPSLAEESTLVELTLQGCIISGELRDCP